MMYAYSENFVLPLSHDEVVHLKRSLLGRMPGDRWQQLANLRLLYTYMWTFPGKKLLFMGGEFAHPWEWNFRVALPWWLLEHAEHSRHAAAASPTSTALYASLPALHRYEFEPQGFQLARLRRRDALGADLSAPGDGQHAGRGAEFHAGAAHRLSRRRAAQPAATASCSTPIPATTAAATSATASALHATDEPLPGRSRTRIVVTCRRSAR